MSSSPSLQNMPHIVIGKIVEHDFRALQTLRKVCSELRSTIDEMKLEANLKSVNVNLSPDKIKVTYDDYSITYCKQEEGCRIEYDQRAKIFNDQDFLSVFLMDFGSILSRNTSILKKFSFSFEAFLSENSENSEISGPIIQIFKKPSLKTRKLVITAFDQSQVMSILPYLDSSSLKSIQIICPKSEKPRIYCCRDRGTKFEVKKILQLEQFKNAEELNISTLIITAPIRYFTGFSTIFVCFETISGTSLLLMKEAFLKSPTSNIFNIKYEHFDDEQLFWDSLKPPVAQLNNRRDPNAASGPDVREWFFRIQGNEDDEVLQILHDPYRYLVDFSRVKASTLHKNVIIQN